MTSPAMRLQSLVLIDLDRGGPSLIQIALRLAPAFDVVVELRTGEQSAAAESSGRCAPFARGASVIPPEILQREARIFQGGDPNTVAIPEGGGGERALVEYLIQVGVTTVTVLALDGEGLESAVRRLAAAGLRVTVVDVGGAPGQDRSDSAAAGGGQVLAGGGFRVGVEAVLAALLPRVCPPVLWEGGHFQVRRWLGWEYLTRPRATGAVVVVAVTPEDRVVLVEQFRPPVNARTLELPAGLIGDGPGGAKGEVEARNQDRVDRGEGAGVAEAVLAAARRELIEETGWDAGRLEVLTCGPTTPGTCDEIVTLVRATQLRRAGGGGGVAQEGEEIVVHEIPRLGLRDWLAQRSREGWLVDVKIYAGLAWVEAP